MDEIWTIRPCSATSEPWWLTEPLPRPEEGLKLVFYDRQVLAMIEDRRYRLRAVASPMASDRLVILLWLHRGELYALDRFDFYDAEERRCYIEVAAADCGWPASVIESDLQRLQPHFEHHRDMLILYSALAERQRYVGMLQ